MSKIENLHKAEVIYNLKKAITQEKPLTVSAQAHAQITESISVKFAEWKIHNHFHFKAYRRKKSENETWKSHLFLGKAFTTTELFNEFVNTLTP